MHEWRISSREVAVGQRDCAAFVQRVHEKRKIIAYILHMCVYNTHCTERMYIYIYIYEKLDADSWKLVSREGSYSNSLREWDEAATASGRVGDGGGEKEMNR